MDAVHVSADLISTVTDAVVAAVTAWQTRPLEPVDPVVFVDALRVKIRDEGTVRSKAVSLALGSLPTGTREILGVWIEQPAGARLWLNVFTDRRARGCHDRLIAVTDGLTGMPEALAASYPRTTLQTCIVPRLRNRVADAGWKERNSLAAALRGIARASSVEDGRAARERFADSPDGRRFPMVVTMWRRAWPHVVPCYAFPPE